MRFSSGKSPNPTGRPKGIKDRRSKYRDTLEKAAPELIERLIREALSGDLQALKACVDRLVPPLKSVSLAECLDINFDGTPVQQSRAILEAAAGGRISIDNAVQLLNGVASSMRILEIAELEQRLEAVEKIANAQGGRP